MTTNKSSAYNKFWTFFALLATFSIGILLGIKLQTQKSIATIQPSKIEEVLRYTESWYVAEVDRDQLIQQTIEAIINNKLTFSEEIETNELKSLIKIINKNTEGSGLDAAIVSDTLLLLEPTKAEMTLLRSPIK